MRDAIQGDRARVIQAEGISAPAKGFFLAPLIRDLGRQSVLVTYTAEQAEKLAADLAAFGIASNDILLLPETSETLLYTEGVPDYALIGKRIDVIETIVRGSYRIVVGALAAFLQRTAPREALLGRELELSAGETRDVNAVLTTSTLR